MGVTSIRCGLPCCENFNFQTKASAIFRIASIILGIILLIAGLTILSVAYGSLETIAGFACAATGVVAFAIGSCFRCVKIVKTTQTEITPQPYIIPYDPSEHVVPFNPNLVKPHISLSGYDYSPLDPVYPVSPNYVPPPNYDYSPLYQDFNNSSN